MNSVGKLIGKKFSRSFRIKVSEYVKTYTKMLIIAGGFSLTIPCAFAYDLNPTLDKVKSESASFIGSNTNIYDLSTTQNDGDYSVIINGTT